MSLGVSFNSQIAAIMDVLAKAAVAEISKLVDEGTVVLRLEMCRRDSEIEDLKRNLQLMERELRKAQIESAAAAKNHDRRQAAGIQISSPRKGNQEQRGHSAHMMPPPTERFNPPPTERFNPPPTERFNPPPTERFNPPPTAPPVPRPRNLDEHGGLGVAAVKAELVEAYVARESAAPEAGRGAMNNFEMEERDVQLWPPADAQAMCGADSVDPDISNTIEKCLQMFSSTQSDQNPAHASMTEGSCAFPSTAGKGLDSAFCAVPVKLEPDAQHSVLMADILSESLHPEQEQYGDATRPAVSEDPTLRSLLRAPGPPLGERAAVGASGSNATYTAQDHAMNRNRFRSKRMVNAWRSGPNQKLFICSLCGKGFPLYCYLEAHQLSHRGVKPYRCPECGKGFTQKTRLKTHQSVHTGEKPYSCKICGKMFSRQDNCIRHERFHSGLKPYSCLQCGKNFTALSNLKVHQQIHT